MQVRSSSGVVVVVVVVVVVAVAVAVAVVVVVVVVVVGRPKLKWYDVVRDAVVNKINSPDNIPPANMESNHVRR